MTDLPVYLLDVNVLVAFGVRHHHLHGRVSAWVRAQNFRLLYTCSITELGFLRVGAQTAPYQLNVEQAVTVLAGIKAMFGPLMDFISDDQDVSRLPGWVKSGKQTTDGHLVQLAAAHGAVLATLDERISGAYLIL